MAYISVVESLCISLSTFLQCVVKAIEFAKIAQTNDHYVFQGDSRSLILVSIESSSRTSYK